MTVSIITVSCNSGQTINNTIQSVLNQDYENIEYIIIDGGSTDKTLEIINQYKPLFGQRMRFISEKDNGIYDAMNKGIRMATGGVVGIINSDDFFTDNNVISQVVNAFSSEKIGAVTGNLHFVSPKHLQKPLRFYSSKFCVPALFRFGLIPAHPTFFVRNKYYQLWGMYDPSFDISGDFDLMIRFLKVHKLPFKYLDYNMVTMRMGGVSTKTLKSMLIDNNRNIIRACKNNGVYTNVFFISFRYFFKIISLLRCTYTRPTSKKTSKQQD